MTEVERRRLFCEAWQQFQRNISWLRRSYIRCQPLQQKSPDALSEDEIERLEALANRFARTVDLLMNKLLRALDMLEMEDVTHKLDIVLRAEKRGFVADYRMLILWKDLRNELAHEYVETFLYEKYREILMHCSDIFETAERIEAYVHRRGYCASKA